MKFKKIIGSEKAIEEIKYEILRKTMPLEKKEEGLRLPPERILAERYHLSRVSIRGALDHLKKEGIIDIKPNSGIFLKTPKVENNLSFISSFTDDMKKRGLKFETILVSQKIVEAKKNLAEKFSVHIGHPLYELSRVRVLDGKPFLYQIIYLDYERFPKIEQYYSKDCSLYNVLKKHYNISIAYGFTDVSLTYLSKLETRIFDKEENAPAFSILTDHFDNRKRMTEYSKQLIDADKVTYISIKRRGGDDRIESSKI